jgi:galactose oxidase
MLIVRWLCSMQATSRVAALCVSLIALAHGAAAQAPLPRAGWTATADSGDTQSGGVPANVLDGSAATFWHTDWHATPNPAHPHRITITMNGQTNSVVGLQYTPRGDGSINGRIGDYEVLTSATGFAPWVSAKTGTWPDTAAAQTATFTARDCKAVRLIAKNEAGGRGGPWASAGDIQIIGTAGAVGTATPGALDRTGWSVRADSANDGNPPANLLDENPATMWHTPYSLQGTPLPHTVTLIMGTQINSVSGIAWLPRQTRALASSVIASPVGRLLLRGCKGVMCCRRHSRWQ